MTEVWFRNPDGYIREMVEVGVNQIAWDRGLLIKKGIDPDKHALLYFGVMPYRILLVGEQGSAELAQGFTFEKPKAVYPTWEYGDDGSILEELIEMPVGEDRAICNDISLPPDERPVFGQEHRVVITNLPPATSGPGRTFLRYLKTLQEDHPDCIIHIHGLYGWKSAFGMGWGAADIQPRDAAAKGKIHLPSGKEERFERAQAHPRWITQMGFRPVDMEQPRNRCMYNIKSAVWAGENYDKVYNMRTRGVAGIEVDSTSSDENFKPIEAKSPIGSRVKPGEGDKMVCDQCSLQNKCSYFREGAVCTVPGADPVELSKLFGTRNADDIIDGLSLIASKNARRLENAIELEEIDGESDPEVTKMFGQVFDMGTKLAKLVDPARFKTTGVQVNVGQGGSAQVVMNPRQMAAAAVRALEEQGVPRDQITPAMIKGMLEGMQNPEQEYRAIQGTVTASRLEKDE